MKKATSLSTKISTIILIMVISSTAIVGLFSYFFNRKDTISFSADRAMAIAESVASGIDAQEFQNIMANMTINDYWLERKAFVDQVTMRTNVAYLYLLDKNYDDNVYYFMEGNMPDDEDPLGLGAEESVEVHADELFATLSSAQPSTSGIYDAEEFGFMISGFAPILDANGAAVGVVGVDLSIDDVLASSRMFGLIILACVIVFSIIFCLVAWVYIRHDIGKPLNMLSKASGMIAEGHMEVDLAISSRDEIGLLTESFRNLVESTKRQISALEKLADGDLTANILPRSKYDSMSFAIQKTVDHLNTMFWEIRQAAEQVNHGSNQISDGAQVLAQGSAEQAAAVQELSASIAHITNQAGQSASLAKQAASLAETIKHNAEKGSGQMDEMISAVQEISRASHDIENVIKVIDDIAFQTNILALNAAVEAARAGQHGKGFAVVAEEVRNLASKSAEAAKNTTQLIANSVSKAELGTSIANATAASLSEIVSGINESNRIVLDIAASSTAQSQAITQINKGLDQVSQVVNQTSVTAEESASASQEMSGQASLLEDMLKQFRIKQQSKTEQRPALPEKF